MADPSPKPLSFRPAGSQVARDDQFDESVFDRAAMTAVPHQQPATAEKGPQSVPPVRRHDSQAVDRPGEIVRLVAVREIDGRYPVAGRDLEPLVRSIATLGVLQPLLVRKRGGRYELIAGARRLAAAMAAGLAEVPCLVHQADDERARALAEAENLRQPHLAAAGPDPDAARRETGVDAATAVPFPAAAFGVITEHLAAITACLGLFGERERPLRERIAMGLIQAEVQRAGWLAQGMAILTEEPTLSIGPVPMRPLVDRIVAAMNPERVFAGVDFNVEAGPDEAVARGDEQVLAIAVTGMMAVLQSMVERVEGARLGLRIAAVAGARQVRLDVVQSAVRIPTPWLARFFEIGWIDRPGGPRAGVAVAAARHIAQLLGGSLELAPGEGAGCRLVLTVPAWEEPSSRA